MTGQEALKIIRASGLSQAEFAKRIGVTATAVQYWRTGATGPSGPAAKLLALIKARPELLEVLKTIEA